MRGADDRSSTQSAAVGRRQVIAATGAALLAAAVGVPALGKTLPPVSVGDAQEMLRYQRERKYAQTRYGRIAYVERGRGAAVLLLHGFPLNSFQWRGVIPRLSAHRRCLAPDFMGLGFTEVSSGQSVAAGAQADMLAAFLDTLGIGQVDIIANDSGGAVAQLFVARYGARARTLLLTNCDVETDSPPESVLPVIDDGRHGMFTGLWLKPWLEDKENLRSSNAFGRLCYLDPSHPTDAAINQYLGPLVSSPERCALTNRFAASLAPNPLAGIANSLRRCQVPTRIVWGMSDRIFSPDNIEYLVSVLPRVTGICRIPQAKLFFPEELPDVIADEVTTLWMDPV
ncbi:MAG TPA: alpha/beta hydrolase [Steroidobacteraceae bacterium]|nr:alpha/beta hydrolase [Steroidobacteraceae bacterium]